MHLTADTPQLKESVGGHNWRITVISAWGPDSGHCMCLVFGHSQHHHCTQSLEFMAHPTVQVLSFS
jgi:hypothetical protein